VSAQPGTEQRTGNPYVGPRPLRRGDPLFGRRKDAQDLADLLIAERVVLLHAPSGAGKTSLIQAGVVDLLLCEGFRVSGPLRLNAIRPKSVPEQNPYIWSVIQGLMGNGRDPAQNPPTLEAALTQVEAGMDGHDHVIVLDQFEEVLTLDPPNWDEQHELFQALGVALENPSRWALISMREDYMGGMARYAGLMPTHLDVTFRLDFLERDSAREAVIGPPGKLSPPVTFTDDAADLLVDHLSRIRVQDPVEGVHDVSGPYVEPVQLQVVCERLWRRMERKHGDDFTTIEVHDVEEVSDIDKALAHFYRDVVEDVAKTHGVDERVLRDWFGRELITAAGFRSQSAAGPATRAADPGQVLRALEDRYLIRSDERNGTRWYELSHDGMVEPVLADNRKWRKRHATIFEVHADAWAATRREIHLLRGEEIKLAAAWLDAQEVEPEGVRDLISASKDARENETLRQRLSTMITLMSVALLVESAVIAWLLATR
jgi:hypothetical protein